MQMPDNFDPITWLNFIISTLQIFRSILDIRDRLKRRK